MIAYESFKINDDDDFMIDSKEKYRGVPMPKQWKSYKMGWLHVTPCLMTIFTDLYIQSFLKAKSKVNKT